MTGRQPWRGALRPFAAKYADLYLAIESHVRALTDEELRRLDDYTRMPTQTNCGWDEYAVAPLIRDAIKREQYRRSQPGGQQS